MGISTCLHVHISTYLGTNWLQSTVTYDHCRNATMLYESTLHICPLELVAPTRPCACCVPSWRGDQPRPRRAASRPTNQLTQKPGAPAAAAAAGITIFTMRSLTS